MTGRTVMYCFPHAGAAAPDTGAWQRGIGGAVELKGLQYPGHGHRFREPLADSIEAIAAGLLRGLVPFEAGEALFFGHSMGGLVAYEVCRQLHERRLPLPRRLIVSGRAAPHAPRTGVAPDTLPDAELLDYLGALGGMRAEVLNDADMCELMLPIVRADFAACRRYAPQPEPPLPVGICVYAGDQDDLSSLELDEWRRCTSEGCTIRRFSGGHFYFDTSSRAFLDALSADAAHTHEQAVPARLHD